MPAVLRLTVLLSVGPMPGTFRAGQPGLPARQSVRSRNIVGIRSACRRAAFYHKSHRPCEIFAATDSPSAQDALECGP
jgi:hypothetical protein